MSPTRRCDRCADLARERDALRKRVARLEHALRRLLHHHDGECSAIGACQAGSEAEAALRPSVEVLP